MSYDLMQNLFVVLPPQYMGRTCGLCGNFNRVAHDDFVMPNGSLGMDGFHFAASWKSESSCKDVSTPGSYPECLEKQQLIQAKYKCWIIQNPQGPFASCHSQVTPEPYMRDCILDLCISALDHRVLCHSIQNYAAACQQQSVNISAWRNESFCCMYLIPSSYTPFCFCTTVGDLGRLDIDNAPLQDINMLFRKACFLNLAPDLPRRPISWCSGNVHLLLSSRAWMDNMQLSNCCCIAAGGIGPVWLEL